MLLLLPDNLPKGEFYQRNGAYTCFCTL